MGSNNIMVFDAKTDQLIGEIFADQNENPEAFTKYPHGISADENIDRMIVTQTVSPALDDPQSSVSVIEFSTGKVLLRYFSILIIPLPTCQVCLMEPSGF
jgi:DNA-binding beta-propeller fold protein YncE